MDKNIYSILNSAKSQDAETERLSETEVNRIMERFNERNNIKKSSGNKKKLIISATAAAAAIVLLPTSVYAYKYYKAEISKTAKYRNTVCIEKPDSDSDSNSYQRYNWDAQLMKYEFGWLPDGFEKPENDWHYINGDNVIAPLFYRLPDNKDIKIDMPWSSDCETYKSDGKTAMINYRLGYNEGEPGNYGREIWVSFDDESYLLNIYITDGISQEDTKKIIDNIKLLPTDEICFSMYEPKNEETSNNTSYANKPQAVDMEKCEIYHVGDTISYDHTFYEDDSYEVTLNSVELTDSFDGINTDTCGNEADYSELMDENGNIIENTRRHIKRGDGIDTLDEVVKEENVPMHILKLNVTYKNTWDQTNEIIICPKIFQMIDNVPTMLECDTDSEYDISDSIRAHRDIGSHFSFDSEKKNGSKNYIMLEPGESAEVKLAFFVADDELDKLYGYFLMSGNELSRSMQRGDCPVFDLRQ